ncbi:MAG: hypothetical protein EBE86_000260 [Hormoscilla sp. GUM202]|nr:hypothetical protein [Hormoscilla sp. GUM202]
MRAALPECIEAAYLVASSPSARIRNRAKQTKQWQKIGDEADIQPDGLLLFRIAPCYFGGDQDCEGMEISFSRLATAGCQAW